MPDTSKIKDQSGALYHIRSFIRDADWPNWYRRKVDATHPPDGANVAHTWDASDAPQDNPNEKVSDNTDLWQAMGQIPVLIIPSGGMNLAWDPMMETYEGQYRGLCPWSYDIRIGDHFIDAEDAEYRVMGITQSFDKTFRVLAIRWLPARGDLT